MIPALESPGALDGIDFLEVAPENWIGGGYRLDRQLRWFSERIPIVAHGLSLSIGGHDPIDRHFLSALKLFMREHGINLYSEHLSFCAHGGQLYDLLPIPFTAEAVQHVAKRIKFVQDVLEMPLVLENSSYYLSLSQDMTELEFITAVLEEANCGLLLDVNNIIVNSVNHEYDPYDFLAGLPSDRVVYSHIAGHEQETNSLIIDTHGCDIADQTWRLADKMFDTFGPVPMLYERDFNIPPLPQMINTLNQIKRAQERTVGSF